VENALSHVPVIFQEALALHQTGQLASAQSLYEDILKIQSDHSDVLHLLGVIAIQTGNFHRAV
jgi:protein O-GlcNAc transferase